MGANGQLRGQTVALERVLRNIVKMFMEEKLTYKPIRTLTVDRDHKLEVQRLRVARKSSRLEGNSRSAWGALEESKAG